MTDIAAEKKAARAAARIAREAAQAAGAGAARQAAAHLLNLLAPHRDLHVIAGYLPIGSEMDPRPAMLALHGLGYRLCVPVVEAPATPLAFRVWTPDTVLVEGRFGVPVPEAGEWVSPDLVLAPLLAFDAALQRLGYGGGFYDRTLAALRARGAARAFGYAYAAQECARVPTEATDSPLDGVITERGIFWPR